MKPLLLHTCCAPCSAAIIEWLLADGWLPTLFYCNPNIFPRAEYDIRKDECTRYAEKLGLRILDGDYSHDEWLSRVAGMEHEPERGRRCLECFKIRLLRSAHMAAETDIRVFATTLASSRWKDISQISEAGRWASAEATADGKQAEFWDRDWRKGGLYERRRELLAENGFYNQQYCGCEFSIRKP